MKTIKYFLVVIVYMVLISEDIYSQVIYNSNNTPMNEWMGEMHYYNKEIYFSYYLLEINTPWILESNTSWFSNNSIIIKATNTGEILDSIALETTNSMGNHFLLAPDSFFYCITFFQGNSIDFGRINIKKLNSNLQIIAEKEFGTEFHIITKNYPKFVNNRFYINVSGVKSFGPHVIGARVFRIDQYCDTLYTLVPGFGGGCNIMEIPNEDAYYLLGFGEVMKVDTNFHNFWSSPAGLMDCDLPVSTNYFWIDSMTIKLIGQYWPTYPITFKPQIGIITTETTFNFLNFSILHYGELNEDDNLAYIDPIIELDSGGYILGSISSIHISDNDSVDDGFYDFPCKMDIRRLDDDFDLIWKQSISHPDTVFVMSQVMDIDDGFIVSCSKHCLLDSIPNRDIALYKFGYNGFYSKIMEFPAGKLAAQVFPNPGQDYFKLVCYQNFTGADLLLHDMAGREVLRQKITGREQEILTALFLPGTYIYSIQKNGRAVHSGKWVKR
ncbi:MAG: T9SS type A sorting domain-containing protein [Bacteroidales bacterium]|nr:T9SS type A sorting domain-containing protein [Bacteroidales bacterium]